MKSKLPDTFAVFILTHGRPNKVVTLRSLQQCGYSGKLYFIIDNQDKTAADYIANFGAENVIIFDKEQAAQECDLGNNFDERRTILMARNACFGIAESLGLTHFLQLDDDYGYFTYKFPEETGRRIPKDIDSLFAGFLRYYEESGALSLACSQMGDFIGGIDNGRKMYRFSKRKCMNTFFCSTKRPFKFIGAMNDDVNTYLSLGSRGDLFLTIPPFGINQKMTQQQKGGLTEMYLKFGTYCKSFTTVMMVPSCCKVSMMRTARGRLHHCVDWKTAVPCIIRQEHKKAALLA